MTPKNRNQLIIITLLLAITFVVKFYKQNSKTSTTHTTTAAHQSIISPDEKLVYTKHARCRMECRNITEEVIREVILEGSINEQKSNNKPGDCPTYALEDDTKEGQHLRIVFAKCADVTKVVTCIDRGKEFDCDCK